MIASGTVGVGVGVGVGVVVIKEARVIVAIAVVLPLPILCATFFLFVVIGGGGCCCSNRHRRYQCGLRDRNCDRSAFRLLANLARAIKLAIVLYIHRHAGANGAVWARG